MAVRPKDRSGLSARQRPFVRSSVIVRSQTFSPGERSQYVCRVRRLRGGHAQGEARSALRGLPPLPALCQGVAR